MTTCSISEQIWKTGDGRRDTEAIYCALKENIISKFYTL